MTVLRSAIIAFSMYSKIPMPRVEWKPESMRYALCFFPWVGAVIAACFNLWGWAGRQLGVGSGLFVVVLLLIPMAITGGIHMDGLMDTTDALSSYQSQERRLEILKDSHAGAFAILSCVLYVAAYAGCLSELQDQRILLVSLGFFLSRALSGLAVASFPCARDSGLAATFAHSADKKRVRVILLLQALLCMALMIFLDPWAGVPAVAAALLCLWYYHHMARSKFGGITGDLAGWFLQLCELVILAAVVLSQLIQSC